MIVDALIVGGGPAGLVAAIYVARFRRSVVVVDANADSALNQIAVGAGQAAIAAAAIHNAL